jgi:hypothetical protein
LHSPAKLRSNNASDDPQLEWLAERSLPLGDAHAAATHIALNALAAVIKSQQHWVVPYRASMALTITASQTQSEKRLCNAADVFSFMKAIRNIYASTEKR